MSEYKDNSENSGSKPFLKSRTGYILLTALLCGISFFTAWFLFHSSHSDKEIKIDNISNEFIYKTTVVKLMHEEEEIEAMGKVTYDENNVVRIYPIVSGEVEDVHVSLGSYVKRGQNLAKIRSADVSDLIRGYNVAKTNYTLAEKKLSITDSLFKSKFSSELEFTSAKNEFKKAKDEFNKTKEVLNLYNINPSQLKPIFTIKSTVDGYIVDKNITNTMLIRPDNGTNLFTISDLSIVWVYANIFEDNIARVKEGQTVTVRPLAYDRDFEGKIDNLSATLDEAARVLKIRIIINNAEKLLKPEMAVNIKIHVPNSEKYLTLPPNAIIFDKDNYFVLHKSRGKIQIKTVEIHSKTSEHTFIKSGIQEGDTVVTQGSLLMYNQIANNL